MGKFPSALERDLVGNPLFCQECLIGSLARCTFKESAESSGDIFGKYLKRCMIDYKTKDIIQNLGPIRRI